MLYAGQGDKEANELAIRIFRRAVDANPNFGPAYLGLAQCFANYLNFGWNAETHWLDKADELTEKGRSLPPLIASAFALRIELLLIREALFGGDSSDLRFAIAREGLARFPADGPLNSIVGYCYLRRFETKGDERDFDEALRYKETAYWAEPYALGNVVLAELYMLKKDFDGALAICDDLRRFLNSGDVDYRRGQILYYMGDFARSEGAFRDMDENTEVWLGSLGHLGMIAAARKDADGAARILRQIELLRPKSDGQYGLDLRLASIYAGLGQSDKAREHLRDFSAQDRYKAAPFLYAKYIAIDKNFDSIRTDIVLAY
jgi:tetratricopeptide (TPR) repeat protein